MTSRTKSLFVSIPILGVIWLGYTGWRVAECRRIVDYESNQRTDKPNHDLGLYCLWRIGVGKPVETTPTLSQVICGARPVEVWLESWHNQGGAEPPVTVERARRMAEALRYFGSLEKMNASYAGDEAQALFMGVGRQPHLTEAFAINVPVTDEIIKALVGFPRLKSLEISGSHFTGRGFPHLPELKAADFQYSPISIDGLRAIVECPKLAVIVIYHPPLVQAHFQALKEIQAKHPKLEGLNFDPPE